MPVNGWTQPQARLCPCKGCAMWPAIPCASGGCCGSRLWSCNLLWRWRLFSLLSFSVICSHWRMSRCSHCVHLAFPWKVRLWWREALSRASGAVSHLSHVPPLLKSVSSHSLDPSRISFFRGTISSDISLLILFSSHYKSSWEFGGT